MRSPFYSIHHGGRISSIGFLPVILLLVVQSTILPSSRKVVQALTALRVVPHQRAFNTSTSQPRLLSTLRGGGGGGPHDGDDETATATDATKQPSSSSSSSSSPMDMEAMKETTLRSNLKYRIAGWLLGWFAQSGQRRMPPLTASVGSNDDHKDDSGSSSGRISSKNNNNNNNNLKNNKTMMTKVECKKTTHIRLIAISVSMYVEKVRWILDLLEASPKSSVYYTEECHPPGVAAYYTTQASKDRASQSPMIVISSSRNSRHQKEEEKNDEVVNESNNMMDATKNEKQDQQQSAKEEEEEVVLWGSDAILHELCGCGGGDCGDGPSSPSPLEFLYPMEIRNDIQTMEKDLGQRLGAASRCLGYNALLRPKYYNAATKVLTNHSPFIERWLYKLLLYTGTVPKIMSQTLGTTNPTVIDQSYQDLRDVFHEMSQRLERAAATTKTKQSSQTTTDDDEDDDEDIYLMDTPQKRYGLTAVDITFASLAYIVLRPPELQPLHINDEMMPPQIMELHRELSATKAGKHALRVYKKHRPIDPTTGYITIKCVNQNKFPMLSIFRKIMKHVLYAIGSMRGRTKPNQ